MRKKSIIWAAVMLAAFSFSPGAVAQSVDWSQSNEDLVDPGGDAFFGKHLPRSIVIKNLKLLFARDDIPTPTACADGSEAEVRVLGTQIDEGTGMVFYKVVCGARSRTLPITFMKVDERTKGADEGSGKWITTEFGLKLVK